jgi:hypothetical protein
MYWVPEGIVMCADSMLTHTIPAPSPVVTNFEYAEKLVVLGKDVAAAAMFSGQAFLFDESMTVVLKRAARSVDSLINPSNDDVYQAVRNEIDSVYKAKAPQIKASFAQQWSTPEKLREINQDRASRTLAPVTVVDAARVAFRHDPANSPDGKRL